MGLSTVGGGLMKSKLILANALESEVLSEKKFYAGDKTLKTGNMPNLGAWGATINPGETVWIPQGYHNGGGNVYSNRARMFLHNESFNLGTGSTTRTFSLSRNAKVFIVYLHSWGYNGTYPTFSGGGIIHMITGDHILDGFGSVYAAAYGYNMVAGSVITISELDAGQPAEITCIYFTGDQIDL